MAHCRTAYVSRWGGWTARVFLAVALAGLFAMVPVRGGQSPRRTRATTKNAVSGHAARKPPPPLVQICVVVRNVRGLAVADLRRSDFRLWDNNRPQQISDFAANIVLESGFHHRTTQTGHDIALYFDDLHYDFTQTIRVTDSAYSYFKSIIGPENKVGVFTSSGEVTLNFTGDKDKLHEALLAIKPHVLSAKKAKNCPQLSDFQALMVLYGNDPLALKIGLDDMNACSTPAGQVDPPVSSLPLATLRRMTESIRERARQVIAESEIKSRKTLEGLDRLITTVSTLPDPRTIIIASPGFLAGSEARQLDLLGRRATHLHIIISVLDSTGLIRQLPDPAPTHNSKLDEEREAMVAGRNQMIADRASMAADVLQDLSTMTGGNFIANKDDLESGFRAAIPLPPAYYVLGFNPTDFRKDGRFHKVRVKVVRPERLGVQAPSGYYAPGTSAQIARSSLRDRHATGHEK